MNAKQLLAAMNQIDDQHIKSAGDRLFRESAPRRTLRLRTLIAAAAAAALLAASFLIPGTITALLILLGNFLDEHHIFELFQWIKSIF